MSTINGTGTPPLPPPGPAPIESRPERVDPLAVLRTNLARKAANAELQGRASQIKESHIEQLKKLGVDVTVDGYQELPSYAQAKEAFGSNIRFLQLERAANEELDSAKSKIREVEKARKIAERRAAREAAANPPLTVQHPIIEVVPDAPKAPPKAVGR